MHFHNFFSESRSWHVLGEKPFGPVRQQRSHPQILTENRNRRKTGPLRALQVDTCFRFRVTKVSFWKGKRASNDERAIVCLQITGRRAYFGEGAVLKPLVWVNTTQIKRNVNCNESNYPIAISGDAIRYLAEGVHCVTAVM